MKLHPRLWSKTCFDYFHTHRIPELDNPSISRTKRKRISRRQAQARRVRRQLVPAQHSPTSRQSVLVVVMVMVTIQFDF